MLILKFIEPGILKNGVKMYLIRFVLLLLFVIPVYSQYNAPRFDSTKVDYKLYVGSGGTVIEDDTAKFNGGIHVAGDLSVTGDISSTGIDTLNTPPDNTTLEITGGNKIGIKAGGVLGTALNSSATDMINTYIGDSLDATIQLAYNSVRVKAHLDSLKTFNVKDYGATGDGVTLDSAAFRNAQDAIPTGGGILYIPPAKSSAGYYIGEHTINTRNGMAIIGSGNASRIWTDSRDEHMVRAYEDTNVYIDNLHLVHCGLLRTGALSPACVKIDNCESVTVENVKAEDAPNYGIEARYSKNIFISDCEASGSVEEHGLSCGWVDNVIWSNCISYDNAERGLEILTATDITVLGLNTYGNQNNIKVFSVDDSDSCYNISIIGGNCNGAAANGISIDHQTYGVTISGVTFDGNVKAITLTGESSDTVFTEVAITNCTIKNSTGNAIHALSKPYHPSGSTIKIDNCIIADNVGRGIVIANGYEYASITNNTIKKNDDYGIHVSGRYFNIKDNTFWRNQHVSATTYQMYINNLSYSNISGNIMNTDTLKNGGIYISATSDSNMIHDNQIFNMSASWGIDEKVGAEGNIFYNNTTDTERYLGTHTRMFYMPVIFQADSLNLPTATRVTAVQGATYIKDGGAGTDTLMIYNDSRWMKAVLEP